MREVHVIRFCDDSVKVQDRIQLMNLGVLVYTNTLRNFELDDSSLGALKTVYKFVS